jgi:GGDEF domain-containing protein
MGAEREVTNLPIIRELGAMKATQSILFRTALIYLVLTLLNITVFILLVFENQLDLISENAVLASLNTGSALKYALDTIAGGKNPLDESTFLKIDAMASRVGAVGLSVFSEEGKALYRSPSAASRKGEGSQAATAEEFTTINTAIMKRDFEDRLFYHRIDKAKRNVELFIPLTYAGDRIAVASVILPMKDIPRRMTELYRQCALMAALILALHTSFVIIISRTLVLPLRALLDATHKMSAGMLDVSIAVVRDDEIGQLGRSFNEMAVSLRRLRDEARESNPLTGLPGNLTISRHIDELLQSGKLFAILYCDLDNFKAYNDAYGFAKGDEALLFTCECMRTVVERLALPDPFIGHEGGDDFIVITGVDTWESYVRSFIALFDEGAPFLYSVSDRQNGFIESFDRKGNRQRFPLMTVSVAVVTNAGKSYDRHQQMAEVAAEVKKLAKRGTGAPGSRFAIDRRREDSRPQSMDGSFAAAAEGNAKKV